METLYYTIEYQTQPGEGYYDDIEGTKYVNVYRIQNNIPIRLIVLTLEMSVNSEEAIQGWWNGDFNLGKDIKLKIL